MRETFKNLIDALKHSRDGVLPSVQSFPPLDEGQLASQLDLEGAAQRRPENLEVWDEEPAELDIRKEIENRARKAGEEYRQSLDLYEGRIRDATVALDIRVNIDAAGEAALSDYKMLAINDKNHLIPLQSEVADREKEYESFRQANSLKRPARIVRGKSRTLIWLVMGLFFVSETVLNGMFFARGSESGLIGGVLQAGVLSLLNMVVAAAFAVYGLPLISHKTLTLRYLGVLSAAFYLLLVVATNVLIAHFRELFIAGDGDVKMEALTRQLATQPFGLTDAESWILALLGVVISISTLISASKLDDSYPGYGELARAREDALTEFAHAKQTCLHDLQARRDDAVGEMTEVMNALRRYQYERQLARSGRERLHKEYSAYLDHLASVHHRLISEYRQTVSAARKSSCQLELKFEQVNRPSFLDSPSLQDLPELHSDRDDSIRHLESYIKRINEAYAGVVEDYDTKSSIAA